MTLNLVQVTLQAGVPPPTDHPLLSEASSAESRDDSLTDLNQSKPDLSQSIDLDNCKNTNFDAIERIERS